MSSSSEFCCPPDNVTSTVFAASDGHGKVPLFMGITADGYLAFSDDAEELRSACGRSSAPFPPGCFLSTSTGLASYEHPKNKVTASPAMEGEIWGATFKVERAWDYCSICHRKQNNRHLLNGISTLIHATKWIAG
ncbi:hypothetical protein OPV22_023220 [Ensete ventricosum]|uniref:DUF3700 domain-containing protein n=1 Tax=Ensete ventricosum TaxID=4639 RepID=A0AAV8QQ59_ENSVE|nr:hypothetical protein OPV22_023220 [Ensete ventricosum]